MVAIQLTNTVKPETKATLTAYERECYDILYQHFHGKIRQAQREVTRNTTNTFKDRKILTVRFPVR